MKRLVVIFMMLGGLVFADWQVSGIVMTPVLALLMTLPLWMAVCIAQFIGALLFYFVDKRIFNVRDSN